MNAFPSLTVLPGAPIAYVVLPVPAIVVAAPLTGVPALFASAAPASPVPPAASKKDKEVTAKEAPKPVPGAGLPAALAARLQQEPPFLSNQVFSVVPTEPVVAIEEESPAPEWYAIMRGRFVGVVDEYLLSDFATSGVARGARRVYDTQANALIAFNKALTWGGVEIV
ncbi:hypothetical protein R3P38DRAFT_3187386 [Favolaschia claudopus]|uniref:Uncharacterized protein n=1 Tax=Favolaschia claudopus TaxID=2862362 RepID=A0AAW0BZF4_9AGAR